MGRQDRKHNPKSPETGLSFTQFIARVRAEPGVFMRFSFLRAGVLPLALLSCIAVRAESPLQVPDVVVSATRSEQSEVSLPAQIQVIGEREIQASGARNIADLLQARGNLVINDSFGDGSRPTVGMRGFSESAHSNTLILVDGRRLNNIDIGSPQLSRISLQDVQRVEIISGSAGALYGDQAVGGVINIITRAPEAFRARLGGGVGSYGAMSRWASVEDRLDNGLSGRFRYEAREADNYRRHNRSEREHIFARGQYDFEQGVVFLEVERSDEDLQTPGALTAAQAEEDRRQANTFSAGVSDTDTDMQRLGGELDLSDHWSLAVEATHTDSTNPFVSFGSAGRQDRRMLTLNPRLLGTLPMNGDELLLTLGLDLEAAGYTIVSPSTNRDIDADNHSLYAQAVIPLSSQAAFTVGGRHARQENRVTDALTYPSGGDFVYEQTVGELGLSWRPSGAWRVYGRVDQNFRFPKIDEQAYTSPGNVLRNQTGESYEAGVEWAIPGRRFAVHTYRLDLEDEIAFDATATQPAGSLFAGANVNFDPTRHDGFNVEGFMELGRGWSLTGSYTYTDAYFRAGEFRDKDISYIPRHMGRFAAHRQVNEAFGLHGEMQFTGERYASGDHTNANPKVDGRTVFNLAATVEMQEALVRFRVNNLFDESYNGFETTFGVYPAPKRNFTAELEWRFD